MRPSWKARRQFPAPGAGPRSTNRKATVMTSNRTRQGWSPGRASRSLGLRSDGARRSQGRSHEREIGAAVISPHRNNDELAAALYWLRRALAIEPDIESMPRKCVTLPSDASGHASAIRACEILRTHLSREPDVAPSATTEHLMAAVRTDQPPGRYSPPPVSGDSRCPMPGRR